MHLLAATPRHTSEEPQNSSHSLRSGENESERAARLKLHGMPRLNE